jgi:hypothetical protein
MMRGSRCKVRDYSDFGFPNRQLQVGRRHPNVAGRAKVNAASDAPAMQHGNDRHRAVSDTADRALQAIDIGQELLTHGRLPTRWRQELLHILQVETDGKCRTFRGEDHGAHLLIRGDFRHHERQLDEEVLSHRVAAFRAGQPDGRHMSLFLPAHNLVVAHRSLPMLKFR